MTEEPDPKRGEKIRDGCEVYASAPQRAKSGERTISMDELTGVQAVERKHPDVPMQPGHVLRRECEYIRHGTLSWCINVDVVTGKVIEPSWGPTRTEEDALAHLQRLMKSDPQATTWHVILDTLNTHQSESLVLWVAGLRAKGSRRQRWGAKANAAFFSRWKAAPHSCTIRRIRSCFTPHRNMLPG